MVCMFIFIYDIDLRSDNLSTSAIGMISCSSGSEGVDYEGDTCNFACNTGYQLTGSYTRTCQSDGSWSGNEANCHRGIFEIQIYLMLNAKQTVFPTHCVYVYQWYL